MIGGKDKMSFGKNLHDLRMKNNMNQHEFAQSIGITQAILFRYENGTVNPSIEILQRIAEVYHVSIDKLFDIPIETRFDKLSDIIRVLIFLQDIGGINCAINLSDSGVSFDFKRDERYSKQICDFMENYLAHKNDFDLIPDEEIRTMSYDAWIEKQLQKYPDSIYSKEEYKAAENRNAPSKKEERSI